MAQRDPQLRIDETVIQEFSLEAIEEFISFLPEASASELLAKAREAEKKMLDLQAKARKAEVAANAAEHDLLCAKFLIGERIKNEWSLEEIRRAEVEFKKS